VGGGVVRTEDAPGQRRDPLGPKGVRDENALPHGLWTGPGGGKRVRGRAEEGREDLISA